jgi:hypothetical protein
MREISISVSDDLDFTRDGVKNKATTTVTVGLNGLWRELDLTEANEKLVRDILDELMAAGHKPEEVPVSPNGKSKFGPNPEKAAFNEKVRTWCREAGLRNSSGTGWAYQTNTSGADYIGEPLLRKYQDHLHEQAAARPGKTGNPVVPGQTT